MADHPTNQWVQFCTAWVWLLWCSCTQIWMEASAFIHNLCCGKSVSLEYIMSCPKGAPSPLDTMRFKMWLPHCTRDLLWCCFFLQPLSGETFLLRSTNTEDGARPDIMASVFWGGRFERTYFDLRLFNPHATSSQHLQQQTVYCHHT